MVWKSTPFPPSTGGRASRIPVVLRSALKVTEDVHGTSSTQVGGEEGVCEKDLVEG